MFISLQLIKLYKHIKQLYGYIVVTFPNHLPTLGLFVEYCCFSMKT